MAGGLGVEEAATVVVAADADNDNLLARGEFLRLACDVAEVDDGDKVGKRWCLRVSFGMCADDAATEEEVDGGARKRDITLASAREREGRGRCSPAPPWMEPRPGPATPCWGSWIEGQSR
jgi:hypothetical protein